VFEAAVLRKAGQSDLGVDDVGSGAVMIEARFHGERKGPEAGLLSWTRQRLVV
jgi:hypothetical protein